MVNGLNSIKYLKIIRWSILSIAMDAGNREQFDFEFQRLKKLGLKEEIIQAIGDLYKRGVFIFYNIIFVN